MISYAHCEGITKLEKNDGINCALQAVSLKDSSSTHNFAIKSIDSFAN